MTSNSIQIAVGIINIAGGGAVGNSSFGLASPSQQQAYVETVIKAQNAAGGIACRQIVPSYYQIDPSSSSGVEQTCLTIAAAKPFLVMDLGGLYTFPACFAQHQIPLITRYAFLDEAKQYYPYVFGLETFDYIERNSLFALQQLGFFDPAHGFKKVGVIYEDCHTTLVSPFFNWLQQAGVPSSATVSYDLGCGSGTVPNPSDLLQAVMKFKNAGVTHVLPYFMAGSFNDFTRVAQGQGFTPRYGIGDGDGLVELTYGAEAPDTSNIANAVGIIAGRFAEERTPGFQPSPGTQRCNSIFAAAGSPPVYQQADGVGGLICSEMWMIKAMIEQSSTIARTTLVGGLDRSGSSVESSYPAGPSDYNQAGSTSGGQYWRPLLFLESCTCWQVTNASFSPSFP